LEYNPGLHAKPDELNQLARIVGNHDRLIMSHMRNEDDDQLEASISELLDQGQFARVHISHLKAVYGSGAERANEILGILRDARNLGVKITADIYPYNASYTGIGIIFPNWAKTEKQFEFAKLNRRDELATYLKNRVNRRNGPEATLLGTEPFVGITLAELAHKREASFEDVLIDEIGPNGASGAYFVMNDELQSQLLTDSYIGICSDGSSNGFHPRGHGTFAKIIERYVLQEKILTLEEAIRKMTSFAASVLAITDRGMLKIGQKADILVFEPKNIKALATYPNPFQLAQGFDIVLVNGEIARKYNHLTGKLSGQVLIP
jgi:N-acyl-D-aspartate/D-glutamate deacylase